MQKQHFKRQKQLNSSECDEQFSEKPRKIIKTNETIKILKNKKNNFMNDYQSIEQIPTYQLTTKQMQSDPIKLLNDLQQKYEQYGAIKIIACQAWNCPFTFRFRDKEVTTRIQCLQQLKQGKPFQQKVRAYRIQKFQAYANQFSKQYRFKTNPKGKNNQSIKQHQYWNLVTNPNCKLFINKDQNKKVVVQYAADLSSSIYGSGFPVYKMPNWLDSDFQYQTNYFNLNNISKSPSSLLSIFQKRKEKISGISYPWVYMGMMFSTFCWHVQDSFLNSLNYNHRGSTKTWYIIPKKYKERFDDYVKMKYQDKNHKKNVLQRITLMLDPLQLIKSGIKVYKVNQRPRQYICTFFKAYHCGFSHGFNVGQAVNFVSVKSLKYIQQAQRFYLKRQNEEQCKPKGLVLCKDWLLYENVNQKKLNNLSKKQCQQFKQYYLEMLRNQFDYLKKQLKLKNKLKYLNKHQIIVIDEQFKYDALKCQFCDNYIYLSAVSCKQCGVLCQNHIDHCQCIKQSKKPSFGLFIRYLNKDRFRIYTEFQLIKNAINAYNIQNKKKLIQNSLNKNEERLDQKPKSKRQSKQNRKIYKIKK